MEIFHMWDVIPLLGIEMPPSGRSSYNVQCPCCDDSPRKKHLNINLKKDVYRCPRCGISGGIFDLYTLYTGVPRDKVRKALIEKLGVPEEVNPRKKTLIRGTLLTAHCSLSCPLLQITEKTCSTVDLPMQISRDWVIKQLRLSV